MTVHMGHCVIPLSLSFLYIVKQTHAINICHEHDLHNATCVPNIMCAQGRHDGCNTTHKGKRTNTISPWSHMAVNCARTTGLIMDQRLFSTPRPRSGWEQDEPLVLPTGVDIYVRARISGLHVHNNPQSLHGSWFLPPRPMLCTVLGPGTRRHSPACGETDRRKSGGHTTPVAWCTHATIACSNALTQPVSCADWSGNPTQPSNLQR